MCACIKYEYPMSKENICIELYAALLLLSFFHLFVTMPPLKFIGGRLNPWAGQIAILNGHTFILEYLF